MTVLEILLLLLVAARLGGAAAIRMGQPPLLGELLAGVSLGAAFAAGAPGGEAVLHEVATPEARSILDLAVFFLMLAAGLEMRPGELARTGGRAAVVALGGLVVPLGLGLGLGWWMFPASEYKAAQVFFLGTALAVTVVPVAVKILMDLDLLDDEVGRTVVGAAVLDDVLCLLLLAVLTGLIREGSLPGWSGVLELLGGVAVFFGVASVAGLYLVPGLVRGLRRLLEAEATTTALLITGLAFSVLAEVVGLHFLIGSFFAGLFFGEDSIGAEALSDLERKVGGVTTGFLAPVYFASVGLHLEGAALAGAPGFVVLVFLGAFVGKLLGAGLGAWVAGLGGRDSAAVGVAMSARGAVELIVADVALRAGLFSHPSPAPPSIEYLFSAVVLMAMGTTLLTPLLLQRLVER